MALIKKLRKKKKEAPPNEKPDVVKTQLRDMVIVPEMTGSIVGVHNGKTYTQVEIKVCLDFFLIHSSQTKWWENVIYVFFPRQKYFGDFTVNWKLLNKS